MIERTHCIVGRLALACLTVSSASLVHAAAGDDSYAVVSLIGDEMSIVRYEPSVGSSLDQNVRQAVPMPDRHFDQLAARSAIDAIHRADPEASSQAIAIADDASFGDATTLFANDGTLPALLTKVRPLLPHPDTHYLVVISKYRSDAHLRTANGAIGSGKLSGLGFYLDSFKRMRSTNTGERGRGLVAPFAYVMVSLVDLRTGAVVRSQDSAETTTRANVGSQATLDPWDALTAEQKVRILDNLVRRAVLRAASQLVAKDVPSS